MKWTKLDFTIDEAVRILKEFGLDEVMKVLSITDQDVTDELLNNIPSHWEEKIMEWFNNYLIGSYIDLRSNK